MATKRLRNIFFKPSPPSSLPPSSSPRTFCDSLIEENIETVRSLITKWDPPISNSNQSSSPYGYANKTTPHLFSNTRQEANQYLNAVESLQSAMQYLVAQDSSSEKLVQAQFLMQLAMKRLEKEFYRILADNRDRLDPESVSSRSSTDQRSSFSEAAMADLKAIADCMISAGL